MTQQYRAVNGKMIEIDKTQLDPTTFDQILEMDDDDERDFSKTIVFEFFTQAEDTFTQMDDCLIKRDLQALSSLGHYLKGSSATLGLIKIKDACEAIQHLGAGTDEAGTNSLGAAECLARIQRKLATMVKDYETVKSLLETFYST